MRAWALPGPLQGGECERKRRLTGAVPPAVRQDVRSGSGVRAAIQSHTFCLGYVISGSTRVTSSSQADGERIAPAWVRETEGATSPGASARGRTRG